MHRRITPRICSQRLLQLLLTALVLLWALSATPVALSSEPGGTPDVVDANEPYRFPGSVEMPDAVGELDRNLIRYAYAGDLAKVKALVDKGANVNVGDQNQRTPLIFAATNGHTPVVKFLITAGAIVDAKDGGGWTALLYASKRSFNDTAALLVDKGADVNTQSKKKGVTALMLAAVWDNEELAQLLLKHGADAQRTDTFGRTARVLAEKKSNAGVLEVLPAATHNP